jgi:muramoyltetrapeptide carboxypeptidase
MSDARFVKPPAVRPGDTVAIVAPASPFPEDAFAAGLAELRRIGFEPVAGARAFDRTGYVAGPAESRAAALQAAFEDPSSRAILAARGGYGSVELLPWLDAGAIRRSPKLLVGYSDITALLAFLTTHCGVVAAHGPCVAAGLHLGPVGYDVPTLVRTMTSLEPLGVLPAPRLEMLAPGEASGVLLGGNLTQLAASMGTPFAFDPPQGCVLFLEEVGERPYRIDRLLTQLTFAGIIERAAAVVFGELPGCDEADGSATARDVALRRLRGFRGPVLWGLPAGHTAGPALTLPLGILARVTAGQSSSVEILEAAVSETLEPRAPNPESRGGSCP